jgi:hypothetical protein
VLVDAAADVGVAFSQVAGVCFFGDVRDRGIVGKVTRGTFRVFDYIL